MDGSVYPDREPPQEFTCDEDRADFVHRICSAWDFGIPPLRETFDLFAGWRDVFDRFPILNSPAYHAFRTIFKWPAIPGGRILEARYERLDRREGRTDPFAEQV